jgi:hypothetical protein
MILTLREEPTMSDRAERFVWGPGDLVRVDQDAVPQAVSGRKDGMTMQYIRASRVSLKSHPVYNERWLQQRIADDPALLGLGDVIVREVERSQPRAGRLDMLLSDPESGTRYEVELQLGSTDESHIIRTIEYWDIEKARYPQYDHVAVIVAEDITSRFLNVISLFNKAIPLIAIQISALEVGDALTLDATVVLDLMRRGTEEEDEAAGQTVDRAYWDNRASQAMSLTDRLFALVREVTGDDRLALKYNKHYIGLAREGIANNFMVFRPLKNDTVSTAVKIPRSEDLTDRLESAGVDVTRYDAGWGAYWIRLREADLTNSRDLLIEMIRRASDAPAEEDADLAVRAASSPGSEQ